MNPSKLLACLLAVVVMTGCISTSGQVQESDFLELYVSLPHDTVLNNILTGFKRCGGDYGQPSVIPYQSHTIIEVYSLTLIQTRSNLIMGRIEILPKGDGTLVRAGMQKVFATGQRRQNWLKWAQGNYVCQW